MLTIMLCPQICHLGRVVLQWLVCAPSMSVQATGVGPGNLVPKWPTHMVQDGAGGRVHLSGNLSSFLQESNHGADWTSS